MYIPAYFHETDLEQLDWLAAHDAFGTLISVMQGAPIATHLPVLYHRAGARVAALPFRSPELASGNTRGLTGVPRASSSYGRVWRSTKAKQRRRTRPSNMLQARFERSQRLVPKSRSIAVDRAKRFFISVFHFSRFCVFVSSKFRSMIGIFD